MMKGYYNLPKLVQWVIGIGIFLVVFVPIALIDSSYFLLFLPLIAPLLNFATVPLLKLIGVYKYLNPFVLSTVQNDKKYDLHNVFTFDYLVHFKWSDRGIKSQKILLGHYFKALLTIIERIENKELSDEVKVVGNSYFFSDRTAEKLGFTVTKGSFFWIFNSCIQFIELSYLYSFSQGRLAIPKFWKVKQAEIVGKDLVKRKEYIEGLVGKFLG